MLPKNICVCAHLPMKFKKKKVKLFDTAKAEKFICSEMHIYCKIFLK